MSAGAILDPIEGSAATVGATPARSSAFSDATVEPLFLNFASPVHVWVQTAPRHGRTLISRLEVTGVPPLSGEGVERVEAALNRLNELLAEDPTADSDPVDPAIAKYALPLVITAVWQATATTEIFPLADGGLLFRWQTQSGSVEAEFDSDGDTIVMIDDRLQASRKAGHWGELWPAALRWLSGG